MKNWMNKKYSPEEWNKILQERVDPKANEKENMINLTDFELNEEIIHRLRFLKAEDVIPKFKAFTRKRLVTLYTWLLDLCDDHHHCSIIFDNIRKLEGDRFIPTS